MQSIQVSASEPTSTTEWACLPLRQEHLLMLGRALQPLVAAGAGWKVRVAPMVESRPPPPLLPPSPPSLFILCPRAG